MRVARESEEIILRWFINQKALDTFQKRQPNKWKILSTNTPNFLMVVRVVMMMTLPYWRNTQWIY